MKNAKIIICLILSITIGIAAATPLIRAELSIKPWVTHVQGSTAPFNIEIVYANFTLTNSYAPITQTSGPTIDYYTVINVTNLSDYRAILMSTRSLAAQEVQSATSRTPLIDLGIFTSEGSGGEAKGAWVDGVYYNITCTIPWPHFDSNGAMTQELPSDLTEEELYTHYYQWIEGVQYFKRAVNDGTGTNTYTYLNMDGKWVDVTGRITIDETERENSTSYMSTGTFAMQNVNYLGSGSKANKDNEYNCFFAPGESRLLVISGSLDLRLPWAGGEDYINPVDVIQSGIVKTLTHVETCVDIDPVENNTFIDTWSVTSEIQELALSQVGNSYIYNAVLSDNQTFQLDKYGFEVFIVPVR